jgi:hypothetical protein
MLCGAPSTESHISLWFARIPAENSGHADGHIFCAKCLKIAHRRLATQLLARRAMAERWERRAGFGVTL